MIWMFAGLAADAIKTGMEAAHQGRMQDLRNDAIKTYNKAVVTQSAKTMNDINIQRTVSRQQTAQALEGVKRQALQEKSNRGVQAAATDTMGASVEHGLMDVDVQLGEATSTISQNQMLQEISFNSAVQRATDTAKGQLQDPLSGAGQDITNAFIGSAIGQIGTSMIANKLQGKTAMGNKPTGAPISAAKGTRTPSQEGWANFFGFG